MKILLLEDDYSLNKAIKETLESQNYIVESFYDGLEAYSNISNDYDLFILDINTPSIEGLDILSHIKSINTNSNVIMISAIIDIAKIKEAYDLGCDDYIKKPFEIDELLFKVQRLEKTHLNKSIFKINSSMHFCKNKKELIIENQKCNLTKNEKNFLYLLISNKTDVINHEQIENFVYQGESKSSDAIRSMVKRLRKKIPYDLIENVLEEGYQLKKIMI